MNRLNDHVKSQTRALHQQVESTTAVQEEIQRVLQETQNQEQYLNELLNVSNDSILTIDHEYQLVNYNKFFAATLAALGLKATKGFDIFSMFPPAARAGKKACTTGLLPAKASKRRTPSCWKASKNTIPFSIRRSAARTARSSPLPSLPATLPK
jgi:transcriptional regulator with PAS, ATPase and Fis domain